MGLYNNAEPHQGEYRVSVRAIFFDAVGTLLHPHPSAAAVYADIGQQFASRHPHQEITRRFGTSFRRQEEHDQSSGNRTSPQREVERWRAIVGEVLDDVADREGCFAALWEHFARPASWILEPDAGPVLGQLAQAGIVLGLASNFDARLHQVRAGFRELDVLNHVIVSAEVGHRKPSRGFFATLIERTGFSPEEILLVGDDLTNDVEGAGAAGLRALLFAPRTALAAKVDALRCLKDLPPRLGVA